MQSNQTERNKMKNSTNIQTMPTILGLIVIFICIAFAFTSQGQTVKHCNGTTVKGTACNSIMIVRGTDFCRLHQPNAVRCAGKNAKGQPCKMIVKKEKAYCRFHQEKALSFVPTF